jgi:5-methylthioadenosine/S-adenosylhomocysteine deaminase
VVSQLVYATGRQQVTDVWIDGRRRLRDRSLVDIDEAALRANARRWRDRIAALRG